MKPFTDPYESVKTVKTTINPAKDFIDLIFQVHGRRGVMQTTINILISKLHEQLIKRNLTAYDPDAFERAVADARIELGRPVEDSDGTTAVREIGGGVAGVAQVIGGTSLSSREARVRAQGKRTKGGKG